MGANAQTSVPTFTAGEVLTAANMNISARTGIPVFADSTARDAAFGGTGEKTLAEGQFAYLESTNATQYYDGAAWQSVGASSGLSFVTGASFTTATSVSLPTDTFSATYRNYLVFFQITAATADANITGRIRAAGSDKTGATYFQASLGLDSGGSTSNQTDATTTSFTLGSVDDTFSSYALVMNFIAPKISEEAMQIVGTFGFVSSSLAQTGRNLYLRYGEGSPFTYDSFSWISSVASSISGAYRVYGYAES